MRTCIPLILLSWLAWPIQLLADPLNEVVAAVERLQMSWLNQQQNKPGVVIDEFNSDGCSGGMSMVWTSIAEVSPVFAERLGQRPPWESCCVAHDRHYWRGESVNGYEKRLQADQELRQCVQQSAREHGQPLAAALGLSVQEVTEMINLTAELMYSAVRAGGAPCSGLPWRWGHGWPECAIDLPVEIGD